MIYLFVEEIILNHLYLSHLKDDVPVINTPSTTSITSPSLLNIAPEDLADIDWEF